MVGQTLCLNSSLMARGKGSTASPRQPTSNRAQPHRGFPHWFTNRLWSEPKVRTLLLATMPLVAAAPAFFASQHTAADAPAPVINNRHGERLVGWLPESTDDGTRCAGATGDQGLRHAGTPEVVGAATGQSRTDLRCRCQVCGGYF